MNFGVWGVQVFITYFFHFLYLTTSYTLKGVMKIIDDVVIDI